MSLFGKPKIGIHATRIFGLAWWDIIFTVIASIIIGYTVNISCIATFAGLFIIGEILHIIFGVDTEFLQFIKKIFRK